MLNRSLGSFREAESRSQAQADEGLPTASIQKNSEKRKRGTSSVIQPISAIIAEVSDDETDQENTRTRKRSRSGSIAQKSFASTSHLGNNLPATPQDRQTALSNVFQDDDNEPTLGVFGSARAEWGRSRLQKSHTSGTTHTSSNDEISTSASAQDPSASTGPASTNHSSPRQQAENTETFFQGADKHTDAATGRGRQDVRARHLNEPSRIYGSLSTQQGHNSRSTREESVSQPNSYQFPSAQSVHSERGARNPSSDPIQHLAQKRIDRDLHIVLQDSSSDYDPEERIKRESPALQPVTYGEGRINAEGAPDVEERSTGERSQWQRQASKAGDHADKRGQAMGLEDWIKGGQGEVPCARNRRRVLTRRSATLSRLQKYLNVLEGCKRSWSST